MLHSLLRHLTRRPAKQLHKEVSIEESYALICSARKTVCPDLHELACSLGIGTSARSMHEDLCGWIADTGDGWCITYNAEHKLVRQRFTLAHMIGHHFYHRDLLSQRTGPRGTHDNRSYRQIEGLPYYNPAILPRHEREATRFAIRLIMPIPIVQHLADEGLNVFQIADRLSTSVQATAIRLKSLKPKV